MKVYTCLILAFSNIIMPWHVGHLHPGYVSWWFICIFSNSYTSQEVVIEAYLTTVIFFNQLHELNMTNFLLILLHDTISRTYSNIAFVIYSNALSFHILQGSLVYWITNSTMTMIQVGALACLKSTRFLISHEKNQMLVIWCQILYTTLNHWATSGTLHSGSLGMSVNSQQNSVGLPCHQAFLFDQLS